MSGTSLDMGSLSLLVLVVVISCCVATLLSWWWVRSMSPRTYQYCATCAHHLGVLPPGPQAVLTDGVVARPWVGCVQAQDGQQGQSGTFQRLGMRTARPGIGLEAGHLETRPLSPVPGEEEEEKSRNRVQENGVKRRSVQQMIMSPASAEVLARRDSIRTLGVGCHMSRRTLVFPTQSQHSLQSLSRGGGHTGSGQKAMEKSSSMNSPDNTIVGAETDHQEVEEEDNLERTGQDIKQRKVRRSVSARKEKSRYTLLKREEDIGFTSQSEDERGVGSRQSRRHYTGVVEGGVVESAKAMGSEKSVQTGGHVNHGFVNLEEVQYPFHVNQQEIRSSVISPVHQQPHSPHPGYQNVPTIQFSPRTDAATPLGAVGWQT